MTGFEYQKLAMRTNDGKSLQRLCQAMGYEDTDVGSLLMGCLGLAGESGELLDLFKKWIFHGKPLDEEHAKKELGDVLWYCAEIAHSFKWDLDEVMQMNVDKLKARYPEGFSTDLSNHRKAGDV
jgi:NTP pyrophosphatase (non-canonical NTP hydrolase)